MDIFFEINYPSVVITAWLGLMAVFVIRRKRTETYRTSEKRHRDTVILHQAGRAPFAPSLSPFAVKLETYLRMAKIPYQNIHDKKLGPKSKLPWIEYNDLVIPDSQHIIEYLNEVRHVDLNKNLTCEQMSIATAFQRMVDEHTYWLMVISRWRYDTEKTVLKLAKWSWFKIKLATWLVNKQTYQQGLGRHTRQEIMSIIDKDFKALSNFLGSKKFIFGDDPCELDCSLFGQLSQLRYHIHVKEIKELFKRYPNLDRYCEQMKSAYWPDWNECVTVRSESMQNCTIQQNGTRTHLHCEKTEIQN